MYETLSLDSTVSLFGRKSPLMSLMKNSVMGKPLNEYCTTESMVALAIRFAAESYCAMVPFFTENRLAAFTLVVLTETGSIHCPSDGFSMSVLG